MTLLNETSPGDDFKTSYGLPSDSGKYCIVVNYVVFEANKIKFKAKETSVTTVKERSENSAK